MNIKQRLLKLDTATLTDYLARARLRMEDRNRMVASAAAHSVAMIERELARRVAQGEGRA